MQAATISEYWEQLSKLPESLLDIVTTYWDETGRPKVMYPKNETIIAILKKNADTGGEAFLEDMKLVFPDMNRHEAAIYYNVFIAGANSIADRLMKKN